MGFLAVPSSHSADERGSAAVPDAVARDTTTTAGAIPDELVGRWLAVIEAKPLSTDIQKGAGQAIVLRTFEIAKTGEGLAVHVHRGQLPDDLKLRIDSRTIGVKRGAAPVASPAAGSVDAMSAPPAADVIAAVARAWPGLATPPPKDERTIATKLSAADSAASADKEQMNPINARFFLTIEETYSPPEARPTRSLSTLAIVDVARNRLSGQAVQALMLPAGGSDFSLPPVPIGFSGAFVAYRIPDSPDAPAAARPAASAPAERASGIRGLFSGCSGS